MNKLVVKFTRDGFLVLNGILDRDQLLCLDEKCLSEINDHGRVGHQIDGKAHVGTRNLLQLDWVRELARLIASDPQVKPFLPKSAMPVQCNYFVKTLDKNWQVPLHRDLSIPVQKKFEAPNWKGWSIKEGCLFVQPPEELLRELLIVRLHLEDTNAENSALEVVPGSHLMSGVNRDRELVSVNAGGVLLMRPLLLHASRKLLSGSRRVLHFVFASKDSSGLAEWPDNSLNS